MDDAIARGGYAPFGSRAGLGFFFAGVGVLLGIATIIVLLAHSG